MYVGRSISEAAQAARHLGAPLYVASAGYGLVDEDAALAAYDITPAAGGGGLQELLSHHQASAVEWWDILCGGDDIGALLRERSDAVLLAALPANYVAMVAGDLLRCNAEQLSRLRLFTSPAGLNELPKLLLPSGMPYDERLESVAGYAGTRADFPQRALRHFVEQLQGHLLSAAAGRLAVESSMASRQKRRNVVRVRADDAKIKQLIQRNWRATGGRSHLMLRLLRDEALVACEQGRFARLWREVRDEKGLQEGQRVAAR